MGGDDDPTVLHWDGSIWFTMPIAYSYESLDVVWVSDTGDVWFADGFYDAVFRLKQ